MPKIEVKCPIPAAKMYVGYVDGVDIGAYSSRTDAELAAQAVARRRSAQVAALLKVAPDVR